MIPACRIAIRLATERPGWRIRWGFEPIQQGSSYVDNWAVNLHFWLLEDLALSLPKARHLCRGIIANHVQIPDSWFALPSAGLPEVGKISFRTETWPSLAGIRRMVTSVIFQAMERAYRALQWLCCWQRELGHTAGGKRGQNYLLLPLIVMQNSGVLRTF